MDTTTNTEAAAAEDHVSQTLDLKSETHSDGAFVFPASFAQQRLWFLNQLDPNDPSYNITVAYRLKGKLNAKALQRSLDGIIRRHEILRTAFSFVDGEPVQIIAPALKVELPVVDLRDVHPAERETETHRLVAEKNRTSFDLATGPLLRAALIVLGEEKHILLLSMHHIVSDGWSMGILCREWSLLYETNMTGKPQGLKELPIQYADFAVWQREWMQGEVLGSQLTYWKKRLADAPQVLDLPADHPRPPGWTHAGGQQFLVLSGTLTEGLRELSRKEKVTPFMSLLAAFAVLLYRYTGQEDILIGTPVANRNRPETEELIGFFVNTLVIRTDLSDNPGFRSFLGRLRPACLEAYDHQDLPFEKLVEELKPDRQLNQSPLFQVTFAFQRYLKQTPDFVGLEASPVEIESGTAKFDLSLTVEDEGKDMRAVLMYKTDLFRPETMTRMLQHYRNVLEHVVADPDQPIGTLPLLTSAEQHRMLVEWNARRVGCPRDTCIHQLFEAQAEQYPDRQAVVFEGRHLTYRELNSRANKLAVYLRSIGAGPEKVIGLCVDRSPEMIVGILGILKSGGAYLPINPDDPAERQMYVVDDAQAVALLIQEKLRSRWSDLQVPLLCLDTGWTVIARNSDVNASNPAGPDNLAYCMYTSGSTGRPKGVMITHRNVVGFLHSYKQVTLDGERRIGTSVAPFSFDTSVEEIFSAICFGGVVHLVRPEHSADGAYFARYLVEKGITTTYIVPALLPEVAGYLASMKDRMKLRCVITGLQPKTERALQCFRDLSPDLRILNAYGPTETTYGATAFVFEKATDPDREVPIGIPFPNYQIYIVDAYLQPVPIGVRGEILIGGVGLARGYLNQPDLTAEKFIVNPFSSDPASRLYRTGDFGRFRSDGAIEFLGRMDRQVKLRGFRIEPGEIESALEQYPSVRQAVVMAREDVRSDMRLVAYLVAHEGPAPPTSELRRYLQKKLPEYMIPSAFVTMEALPLTSSGKVDVQALPAPDQKRPGSELEGSYIGPRDELERELVQIWERVLNVKPVGVMDNFFDLGGHSLLAVRLFAEIRDRWKREWPLSTLFQGATVEDLARVMRSEKQVTYQTTLVQIQAGGDRRPLFCVVPVVDDALGFLPLARALGPDQPFYGLQFPVSDESPRATSIETMAAQCIKSMQSLQPEGPYLLGGVCLGGFVAYEMACQLHADGHTVPLLFILDSSQPPPPITLREYIPRLLFHHLPRGEMFYCLRRDLREKIWKYGRRLSTNGEGRRFYQVWRSHEDARRTYKPQPYDGRIMVFLSQEFSIRFPHYVARWSDLARGGVDLHILPHRHTDALRTPQAKIVAEKLTAFLNKLKEQER